MLVLAGFTALLAPAVPFIWKYGAVPQASQRPVNLLLAGVTPNYDTQAAVWPYPAKPEDFTGLTDTIVLAQLRPDGSGQLLSIPRDTWTELPDYGLSKINAGNAVGGPQTLVGAVENLTGLHVDGYALLSLRAVRDITDAAGGVTLDVPKRMKYDDNAGHLHIDLYPGRQHLNGQQSEGFLRFRKDERGDDVSRVGRQQIFLTAMLNHIKNPLHWWRIPAMVGAADRNMKSDFTRQDVAQALGSFLKRGQMQMHTVPGDFGPHGTWLPDRVALDALVKQHFNDPFDPRNLAVAVVNVGAPSGSAGRMRQHLLELGYHNVQIATGQGQRATTTVTGNPESATTLQQDVGFGQVAADEVFAGSQLTVWLGADTPTP